MHFYGCHFSMQVHASAVPFYGSPCKFCPLLLKHMQVFLALWKHMELPASAIETCGQTQSSGITWISLSIFLMSQNKPDEEMIKGNRIAEDQYLDSSCSRDPNHLRGQFVPWARLQIPKTVGAFKITQGKLLVCTCRTALLYNIKKARLHQKIEVDANCLRQIQNVNLSESSGNELLTYLLIPLIPTSFLPFQCFKNIIIQTWII